MGQQQRGYFKLERRGGEGAALHPEEGAEGGLNLTTAAHHHHQQSLSSLYAQHQERKVSFKQVNN